MNNTTYAKSVVFYLKVLLQVRDPRGIMNSRLHMKKYSLEEFKNKTIGICTICISYQLTTFAYTHHITNQQGETKTLSRFAASAAMELSSSFT